MAFEPNIGEQILWKENPSWKGMLAFYIKFFLMLAAVVFILRLMSNHDILIGNKTVVSVFLLGSIIILAIGYVSLISTTYIITNQRILHYSGILVRKRDECTLLRIQNTVVSINLIERILGIGKIQIDTAADDRGKDIIFWGIASPYKVASHISTRKDEPDHELEI